MATFEERLTVIEHEQAETKQDNAKLERDNAELKQKFELQTIAIGALVNKATLERVNEKNDKIFDALITHDRFTNEQLAELRGGQIELDGKIVGAQTEMRQRFAEQDNKIAGLDGKIVGVQTEMRQGFEEQDKKFDQVLLLLKTLTDKPQQEL